MFQSKAMLTLSINITISSGDFIFNVLVPSLKKSSILSPKDVFLHKKEAAILF